MSKKKPSLEEMCTKAELEFILKSARWMTRDRRIKYERELARREALERIYKNYTKRQ